MVIAISTTEYNWLAGTMNITCDPSTSALLEISQDGLPFVKVSNEGAGVIAGVIPADSALQLTNISNCKVRFTFTGSDVISFLRG